MTSPRRALNKPSTQRLKTPSPVCLFLCPPSGGVTHSSYIYAGTLQPTLCARVRYTYATMVRPSNAQTRLARVCHPSNTSGRAARSCKLDPPRPPCHQIPSVLHNPTRKIICTPNNSRRSIALVKCVGIRKKKNGSTQNLVVDTYSPPVSKRHDPVRGGSAAMGRY